MEIGQRVVVEKRLRAEIETLAVVEIWALLCVRPVIVPIPRFAFPKLILQPTVISMLKILVLVVENSVFEMPKVFTLQLFTIYNNA